MIQEKMTAAAIESGLANFTGSETVYRHWTGRLNYTEGMHWLAENAGAHWLIDAIASHQTSKLIKQPGLAEFQLWELRVQEFPCEGGVTVRQAHLTCRADSDCPPATIQFIEFTDFPLEAFSCYVCGRMLLLKSEY